jgi:hypothetical protein
MNRLLLSTCLALVLPLNNGYYRGMSVLAEPIYSSGSETVGLIDEIRGLRIVEVIGVGRTMDEARLNGFRLAVEEEEGSVVASESETNQSRLNKDQIVSYASGHVDHYEVLSTRFEEGLIKTRMKVWVKGASLDERLMNRSDSETPLDGQQISDAMNTRIREKVDGDRLYQGVLDDFPARAFVVETGSSQFALDHFRHTIMTVPLTIEWSEPYLESLELAIKETAQSHSWVYCRAWDKTCPVTYYINVVSSHWMGADTVGGYSDSMKYAMTENGTLGKGPSLRLILTGADQSILFKGCSVVQELDNVVHGSVMTEGRFIRPSPTHTTITFNGRMQLHSSIVLDISNLPIHLITGLSISVVPRSQC